MGLATRTEHRMKEAMKPTSLVLASALLALSGCPSDSENPAADGTDSSTSNDSASTAPGVTTNDPPNTTAAATTANSTTEADETTDGPDPTGGADTTGGGSTDGPGSTSGESDESSSTGRAIEALPIEDYCALYNTRFNGEEISISAVFLTVCPTQGSGPIIPQPAGEQLSVTVNGGPAIDLELGFVNNGYWGGTVSTTAGDEIALILSRTDGSTYTSTATIPEPFQVSEPADAAELPAGLDAPVSWVAEKGTYVLWSLSWSYTDGDGMVVENPPAGISAPDNGSSVVAAVWTDTGADAPVPAVIDFERNFGLANPAVTHAPEFAEGSEMSISVETQVNFMLMPPG